MDESERRKKRERARELKRLGERASALLAAVLIMLALLFTASFPQEIRELMADAMRPGETVGSGLAPRPTASVDDPLFIRLADVDEDVGPEIIVRLMEAASHESGVELKGDEPRVLVYHTHDTEAYRPTEDSSYEPSGLYRTEDEGKNVIAVGEELCRILREDYGISAIHATERHEKPLITTAYSRSFQTALKYKKLYPSLELFIDLHRDGVAETGYEDDFVTVDGLECARMMFVVGTGSSGKSSEKDPGSGSKEEEAMPDFETNYALAVRLTKELLSVDPRFMRNVRVKSGKYNQQVAEKCLLVEVGHNGNTLGQAKNSMRFLAEAISKLAIRN